MTVAQQATTPGEQSRAKKVTKGEIICPDCGAVLPRSSKKASKVLLDFSRFPEWLKRLFAEAEESVKDFLRRHPQLVIWQEVITLAASLKDIKLDYLPMRCGYCRKQITIRD